MKALFTSLAIVAVFGAAPARAEKPDLISEDDIDVILNNYEQEISAMSDAAADGDFYRSLPPVPGDVDRTWRTPTGKRILRGTSGGRFSLEDIYRRTLGYSSQIAVFSDLPLIRETGLPEAQGAFDTRFSMQVSHEYRDEPVGNVLTTGGPTRFLQHESIVELGVKKKIITGGELYLSQRLLRTDNNSIFFQPDPQAAAELVVGFRQPILRGAGIAYNEAPMEIAKLDGEAAMSEFIRQSESHLLEVNRAYWTLYMARALLAEKRSLVGESDTLLTELEGRADIDAMQSQLLRARSAAANRKTSIVRAELAVRNAEDRLKALVNDPAFNEVSGLEMIPSDRPRFTATPADMRSAVRTALHNRSEIKQAFLQLKATALRLNMSRNELLPQLDLVLEGRLGGLRGSNAITDGFNRQFTEGGPGYFVGLVFEMPLENQTAKARYERRRLEMRQQLNQLKTTIETVLLEAKVSAREVRMAYRDIQGKYQAVSAARQEMINLTERREVDAVGAEGQYTSFYLENLLDAQDRQFIVSESFLTSVVTYNAAIANLQRAQGTFLPYEDITVVRTEENGLPRIHLEKGASGGKNFK